MSTEPIITRSNFMPRRFPPELLFDIFTRLPGKSVLRFKCASKSIRSMLEEEPHFINRHLKHTLEAKRDRILLLKHGKEFYCVDLDSVHHSVREIIPPLRGPGVEDPYEFKIVGSCNGLFCLVYQPTHYSRYRHLKTAVVLWNVLTGEYKILPIDEARHPDMEKERTYCFGSGYGFGYDAISNDYKVVRIFQFLCAGISTTEAKVCSVKENTWRNVQSACRYLLDWVGEGDHGVFVNGALHWGCYDRQPYEVLRFPELLEQCRRILAFNLETEEFGWVPCNMSHAGDFHLGAIDGQLSISHSLGGIVKMRVMNDYGVIESWCHLVNVPPTDGVLVGYGNSWVRPLAYSKSRNEVLVKEEFKMNHVTRRLTWCDLATQQTRDWEMPRFFDQVEVGVASLVSLGDGIGIGRNR